MPSIKVNQFKGLSSYLDISDLDLSYASEFKNIIIYPGYIKSSDIEFEELSINIDPEKETIVTSQYVFIEEDIHSNYLFDGELINNYIPATIKVRLIITNDNSNKRKYYFYANHRKLDFNYEGSQSEFPLIVNENGIAKIFFKHKTFYLTILNRLRLTYSDPPTQSFEDIGLTVLPLIYSYNRDNFNLFKATPIDKNESFKVKATVTAVYDTIYEHEGLWKVKALELSYKENNENKKIYYPGKNGYFNIFKARMLNIVSYDYIYGYAIWEENRKYIINLFPGAGAGSGEFIEFLNADGQYVRKFRDQKFFFIEENDFNTFTSKTFEVDLAKITTFDNSLLFGTNVKSEFVTTIETINGEFVYDSFELDTPPTTEYSIKIELLSFADLPKDVIAVHLYFGYKEILEEESKLNTFQHQKVLSFPLVTGKAKGKVFFINKMTPTGIYLFQTIGTEFNKYDYKIMDGFDYYKTIGGVSFAIKNNTVYYPAVGFGQIQNNIFYSHNYIPYIKSFLIADVKNRIGLFEIGKEKLTIIDYSPVEGQMVFQIAGSYQYKVKNYNDIIESAEGIIINTYEGIFIVTDEGRISISNLITDIIKRNYKNSIIYYNEKLKELYYFSDECTLLYRFETQSWTKLTALSNYKIIKIFDDYEGKVYIIADKTLLNGDIVRVFGTINYKDAEGLIEYNNVTLNEIASYKILEALAFDYKGKISFVNRNIESNDRNADIIYNPLENRKVDKYLNFNIKFKGIIYNLEVFYQIFSSKLS